MSVEFTITVDGVPTLVRAFNRIEREITDLFDVWREVQKEFFAIEREQFRTEGAAGASGKWKPLSPAYAKLKRKKYGNLPILQREFALIKSLTGESTDTIRIFGKDEALFGSAVPYGKYHQRGGGRLPQRKPIDPSDEQLRRIQKAIQRGLVKIIRNDPEITTPLDVE